MFICFYLEGGVVYFMTALFICLSDKKMFLQKEQLDNFVGEKYNIKRKINKWINKTILISSSLFPLCYFQNANIIFSYLFSLNKIKFKKDGGKMKKRYKIRKKGNNRLKQQHKKRI